MASSIGNLFLRKGDTIYHQLRKVGCSVDWERACFTMDEVKWVWLVDEVMWVWFMDEVKWVWLMDEVKWVWLMDVKWAGPL